MRQTAVVRVEITDVKTDEAKLVYFQCVSGTGAATWCGSEPPVRGNSYDVELGHDLPLHRGADGSLTDGTDSACRLDATVDDVDENLVLTLRVGSGVTLVQLGPGQKPPARGTNVELVAVALKLYPTET